LINLIDKLKITTREEASKLLFVFNNISPIGKGAENFLIQNLHPIKLAKGKILHHSGEICEQVFFVLQGAVRGYIKEDDKDSTTWITIENEMVAAIYSFINQVPSIENMQAIEDCSLLAMSHTALHEMFDLYPETNVLARKIFEKYYSDAEVRALIARLKSADKKYKFFLETYSHLSNRIPFEVYRLIFGYKTRDFKSCQRIKSKKKIDISQIN
jgi:CRP-like cAMP-binding protein